MLEKVDAGVVRQAREVRQEIAMLQRQCETLLGAHLGEAVAQSVQGSVADRLAVAEAVEVELDRGYTCSNAKFLSFLRGLNLESLPAARGMEDVPVNADNADNEESEKLGPFRAQEGEVGVRFSSALLDPSAMWLAQLPLRVQVDVESGHGSRVLPEGQLRVDSSCSLEVNLEEL